MINSNQYKPNEVLFWTGAGISMDPPSCLPSGYDLTKDIVDAFCLKSTWKKIEDYLFVASINDASGKIKRFPRLESILGSIANVLGYDFLSRFNNLFNPTPNFFHLFFAHHIDYGGSHITLNLDIGIENAIQYISNKNNFNVLTPENFRRGSVVNNNRPFIFHLHGKQGDDLTGLGLTIENVSKGLSVDSKKFLLKQFHQSKLLVIAGYSGSDVFDVTPFFLELYNNGEKLPELNVIWIDHSNNYSGISNYSSLDNKIPILNVLSECGANCYIWSGETKNFFVDFVNSWKITNIIVPPTNDCPSFDKAILFWQRALVTAKIFVSMGLGKEAQSVLKRYPIPKSEYNVFSFGHLDLEDLTPGNRVTYLFNESLRERGLYEEATAFTKQIDKITKLDNLLFLERRASDTWLLGRLFYARLLYLGALQYGFRLLGASERFDNLFIECLRGYMQVCRDISHIPLIGKYLARKYFDIALIMLRDEKLKSALMSSPYDMSHIARIFLWELDKNIIKYLHVPNIFNNESIITNVFSETDNLLGYVNTLRSRLHKKLSGAERIKCNDALQLFVLSQKIDNHPGIIKACTMLASIGLLNFEVLRSFFYSFYLVQWTFIKKLSYLAIFLKGAIYGALIRRCT